MSVIRKNKQTKISRHILDSTLCPEGLYFCFFLWILKRRVDWAERRTAKDTFALSQDTVLA